MSPVYINKQNNIIVSSGLKQVVYHWNVSRRTLGLCPRNALLFLFSIRKCLHNRVSSREPISRPLSCEVLSPSVSEGL